METRRTSKGEVIVRFYNDLLFFKMASSKLLLVYTKCQVTIVPYLDADQIPKELGYESSQLRESMLRIKNK